MISQNDVHSQIRGLPGSMDRITNGEILDATYIFLEDISRTKSTKAEIFRLLNLFINQHVKLNFLLKNSLYHAIYALALV